MMEKDAFCIRQEVPMGELARIALIAIVCVGACAIGMLIGKGR